MHERAEYGTVDRGGDGEDPTGTVDRRNWLKLIGVTLTFGAGCLGGGDDDEDLDGEQFGYGGYPVGVAAAAAGPKEDEPNDTPGNATQIETGVEIRGKLDRDDLDYYTFDASAGETIEATFERNRPRGLAGLALYGPDAVLREDEYARGKDETALEYRTDDDGTHFLVARDVDGGTGPYQFVVETTQTEIPTPTATRTPTDTPTSTPTKTQTEEPTSTATPTETATPTDTPVPTATSTDTPTPTDTPTEEPTATETPTPTPTETSTETPTDTPTPTPTETQTETPTETSTPTSTETPTDTPTPTETATPTETPTPTQTPDERLYGVQGYGEYGYGGVSA